MDPVWNFTWEETGFNIEDIQPCPGGEGGETPESVNILRLGVILYTSSHLAYDIVHS